MFWEFSEKGIVFFPDRDLVAARLTTAWNTKKSGLRPKTG